LPCRPAVLQGSWGRRRDAGPFLCFDVGNMAQRERSTGDLSRSFVGGTMQQVEDGKAARDGRAWLFLAADWEGRNLQPPPLIVSRSNQITIHCEVAEQLLMCSCILILQGKQCGPLHLALVAHCRDWLWSHTDSTISRREVEGSGVVDYLNLMWCIDGEFKLYRNVTSTVGMCEYHATNGSIWDGFWYIYRRGETTPAYSHIGLDRSASLKTQTHVCSAMQRCVERACELHLLSPPPLKRGGSAGSGIFNRWSKLSNIFLAKRPETEGS